MNTASVNTTKTPKFRPYLSLEELSILITAASSVEFTTPILQAAISSLTKTKILAENGIKTASYITNPRKSLEQKLGFSPLTTESPDFDSMMESLEIQSIQSIQSIQETKESK